MRNIVVLSLSNSLRQEERGVQWAAILIPGVISVGGDWQVLCYTRYMLFLP